MPRPGPVRQRNPGSRHPAASHPPDSVDLVFICATYHHFTHVAETLASIKTSLRAGGRMVVVDFHRTAEADARNVLGVAFVENDLTPPPSGRSDLEIRTDLTRALEGIPALHAISYEVRDGIVTLSGPAPSWGTRAQAEGHAASAAGVQEVVNHVTVSGGGAIPDTRIAQHIAQGLGRSGTTAFVADRIEVEVDQGVVRLHGDVDTWGQWRAAQQIARRTPGARSVENELAVDPYPFPLEPPTDLDAGELDTDPLSAAQP